MPRKSDSTKFAKFQRLKKKDPPAVRKLSLVDRPETDEYEIQKKVTDSNRVKKIRLPKKYKDQLGMMPDKFANAQNAINEYKQEQRQVEVFATSLESFLGYDSLLRVMGRYFNHQVAFHRTTSGGGLSLEEARKQVYRRNITDQEAMELLDQIMRIPTERISFYHLLELNRNSPATAQNIWEAIKREAGCEFESGHRAAAVFEPADYMTDAWNRASYLGLRESLCEEWEPKGGIELTMIDAIAQAWLQLQFWTRESVKRAQTKLREESHQFVQWKQWNKEANPKQWEHGFWDLPFVSEQEAISQAAQMADRWQRMYFRALRGLRDWRRYTPQLTINNPQQVNIAGNGGQQVNVVEE